MTPSNINDCSAHEYERFIMQAVRERIRQCLEPGAHAAHHSAVFYKAAHEGSLSFGKPREEVVDNLYRRYETEMRTAAPLHGSWRRKLRRLRLDLSKRLVLRPLVEPWYRFAHLRRVPPVEQSAERLGPRGAVAAADAAKVSVVIVSYNRLEYLRNTLRSFFATLDYSNYELIVVDNGSGDGSAEYLRRLAQDGLVTKLILRGRNHGTSGGFNCGFAYADADADYYVKLDSDIQILTFGWMREMLGIFERHPRVSVLALNQVNHPVLRSIPPVRAGRDQLLSWSHWVIGGACMTIPRPVFDRLGYFNEDYTFSYMPDDIDYYIRLSKAGGEAYYVKRLTSYHQYELDETAYKSLKRAKREVARESLSQQHAFYTEQDKGLRPLGIFYDKYRDCRFPPGTRVLEID